MAISASVELAAARAGIPSFTDLACGSKGILPHRSLSNPAEARGGLAMIAHRRLSLCVKPAQPGHDHRPETRM